MNSKIIIETLNKDKCMLTLQTQHGKNDPIWIKVTVGDVEFKITAMRNIKNRSQVKILFDADERVKILREDLKAKDEQAITKGKI